MTIALAKHVVIRRTGGNGERVGSYEFTIDGEPFPWAVDLQGFQVPVPGDAAIPTVTFTLLAERVEVLHALAREPQEPE